MPFYLPPTKAAKVAVAGSSTDGANSSVSKTKCRRSTDLSTREVVILLREVPAALEHVPHGTKSKRFAKVSDALNSNVDPSTAVEAKSVCDCYDRLQRVFSRKDRRMP